MAWTRLQDTQIWADAEVAYSQPNGRHYHNMGHVLRLYDVAEETVVPYDRALDLAILGHDVIYDDKPQKELRSAEWLMSYTGPEDYVDFETAYDLIMSTADHTPCEDNRLILLDLHDLGDHDISIKNRELVASEFQALNGITREQFLDGNTKFMLGLADRIDMAYLDPKDHEADIEAFHRISSGIRATFGNDETDPIPR